MRVRYILQKAEVFSDWALPGLRRMMPLARTRGIRILLWRRDRSPESRDVAQGRATGTDWLVRGIRTQECSAAEGARSLERMSSGGDKEVAGYSPRCS